MVISILEFISKLSDRNIVKYSLSRIQNGNIINHFNKFQKIHLIGPKCSSFYLRDLSYIYPLDKEIKKEDLIYLQPIDVWVKKIALKAEIINENEKNEDVMRKSIVKTCLDSGVSATEFNQEPGI
ncbi:hypothetical protein MSHOH_1685 [Methanosarcina horonobensis HB-1 = JCM 15518]|uniref:Uncharacterized protein n=2 Tax=Methanosarcina horonobensis TaxID=418008 RepID=A0A0E3SFB9_9EURY|nr:hypothetical protein MSHOH_1685 [Methanosarcina horonobensis HB-1 = JCM 15518]